MAKSNLALAEGREPEASVRAASIHAALSEITVSDLSRHDIIRLRHLISEFSRNGFQQGAINGKYTAPKNLSTSERLALLDERFGSFEGRTVAEHIRELFPQIVAAETLEATPTLPTKAPATWKRDHLPGEDAPAFVRRVYGPWIGHLAKPDIRQLDPSLYGAIHNYTRHHAWPEDLPLPTQRERNDARLEALVAGVPGMKVEDIRRLGTALASRPASANQTPGS